MRYLLNSAVITSPGTYEYRLAAVAVAKAWLAEGAYYSTIGYEETAEAFSRMFDVSPPVVNKVAIRMEAGDEALVFRLNFPAGTPRVPQDRKGMLTPEFVAANSEIGILKRLS